MRLPQFRILFQYDSVFLRWCWREKVEIPYLTGCIGFRHDLRIVRDDFVVPFHDSGNLLVIIPVDLPAILLERILHSPDPFKLGLVGRWFAASALVAVPTSTRVRVRMLDTDKGRHLHDEIRALLGLDNLVEDLTRRYASVFTCTAEVIQRLLKMFVFKTLTDGSTLCCANILCSVTRT